MQELLKWLESSRKLESVEELWSDYVSMKRHSIASRIEEIRSRCDILERILSLSQTVSVIEKNLQGIPDLFNPVWHEPNSVAFLKGLLMAVTAENIMVEARHPLNLMESKLRAVLMSRNPHPVVQEILDALRNRDCQEYAAAYSRLTTLKEIEHKQGVADNLLARLRASAPDLAEELTSDIWDNKWDDRMARLDDAWNWARAESWLKKIAAAESQERLAQELTHCRNESRNLIGEIAAAKAWDFCFQRMTEAGSGKIS